jgi:methylene-tetrahydromethanopterin dehydrogenase
MVAKVEKSLARKFDRTLKGTRIAIFGATGVVGFCTAVIAAKEGAEVTLVGHDGEKRVRAIAEQMKERFGVKMHTADGSTDAGKKSVVAETEVVLAAARAGVQVLSSKHLADAGRLLVAADVNAVPPAGVEGLSVHADSEPIEDLKAVGVGPLAIGNVKYKVESGLFKKMIEADKVVAFDFQDAFALAREIAK